MEPLSADDPPAIGGFRLRARLGSGGMGRVYLGYSPAGRAVAVKIVHPHIAGDHEFRQRFRREVEAASKVSGMYAAAVVASGATGSPPWLATAYVPGPSLAALVDSHGPLPAAAVWRLAAGLCEALRNVHDAGLVHRDLKPQNVLIADDGPHVIDFGVSRAFGDTQLTAAGMLIGTPGYMAPEQAEGEPASPASDIFALGCVLAYAAAGKPPFGAGHHSSVLYRAVHGEPDLDPVPPSLRRIIQACLAKDPARRPGLAELTGLAATAGRSVRPAPGSYWPEPVAGWTAAALASTAQSQARLARHTPGRQQPAVPRTIRNAVRLMYLGFAVTLTALVLSLTVLGRYSGAVSQARQAFRGQAEYIAAQLASVMAVGVAADLVGLAGWAWLAVACRRGAGWTRIAGTALAAIYSVCAPFVALATRADPGPRFATLAVWAIGLVTALLLWSRTAGAFFTE